MSTPRESLPVNRVFEQLRQEAIRGRATRIVQIHDLEAKIDLTVEAIEQAKREIDRIDGLLANLEPLRKDIQGVVTLLDTQSPPADNDGVGGPVHVERVLPADLQPEG